MTLQVLLNNNCSTDQSAVIVITVDEKRIFYLYYNKEKKRKQTWYANVEASDSTILTEAPTPDEIQLTQKTVLRC